MKSTRSDGSAREITRKGAKAAPTSPVFLIASKLARFATARRGPRARWFNGSIARLIIANDLSRLREIGRMSQCARARRAWMIAEDDDG